MSTLLFFAKVNRSSDCVLVVGREILNEALNVDVVKQSLDLLTSTSPKLYTSGDEWKTPLHTQSQRSLPIENKRANIASMDSKVSTRKPKSKQILRHSNHEYMLISARQNTEIVSAFFDFRQGRRMVAILGCEYRLASFPGLTFSCCCHCSSI